MRTDTPPPEEDTLSDSYPGGIDGDDIEIIEDFEIEESLGAAADDFDEAKLTFAGHSGPVFCCAFDKNNQYAVTGSQDDKACVWNPRTGEIIFECKGHKDSVISASFSFDGKYVASADMSGVIQVWSMSERGTTVFDYELTEDLRFLKWNGSCNVLFAGEATGNCWMWKVPSGQTKVFQGSGSPCSCGSIMPSGLMSVVGFEDGTIRFLDLKTTTAKHTISGQTAHQDAITTIDCDQDNNLVLTGSLDGTCKLIKSSDGKVLFTVRCEPEDIENKSVECVSFFQSHPLIATGTICGSLAIWDMSTQVRRLQCEQESSITKLICDTSGPMVFTSGIDGIVRLIDGRTGQLEKVWGGHSAAVLDMTLSSDGTTILTASDDGTCKIFDTRT